MKVIAFIGAHGAGKDYIADKIMYEYTKQGYSCIKLPFAGEVKETAASITGEPLQNYYDPILKLETIPDYDMTRRELMEKVTELGFSISHTFWFDKWEKVLLDTCRASNIDYVFVTDYRYEQSLTYIKKYGELIYIKNEVVEGKLAKEQSSDLQSLTLQASLTITNSTLQNSSDPSV